MDADELRRYREIARSEGIRLSEWVRRQLRTALRDDAPAKRTVEQKLRAIRVASSYSFPAPDIDQMLTEIERGRHAK